jgi:hypothetical protein
MMDYAAMGPQSAGSKDGSDHLFKQLSELCTRLDVARHIVHRRWSAHRLSPRECQIYVEEYDHLMLAVAGIAERAAEKASGLLAHALTAHARQERVQLARWRELARTIGWDRRSAWYYGADPLPSTQACARIWTGQPTRSLALDLTTLYVGSSPQMTLSEERAELMRAALTGLLADTTHAAVLVQARSVLQAHWTMLDGLQDVR